MLKRTTLPLLLSLAACTPTPSTAPVAAVDSVGLKYETVPLDVKGKTITAEIADDDATVMFGLMRRPSMPADMGMIFVFDEAGKYPFWMKNTLIDLDIIWLSPTGKVVEIVTMKAHDEVSKGGSVNAQWVLELNAGTAQALGLKVGDSIPIPRRIVPIPALKN